MIACGLELGVGIVGWASVTPQAIAQGGGHRGRGGSEAKTKFVSLK